MLSVLRVHRASSRDLWFVPGTTSRRVDSGAGVRVVRAVGERFDVRALMNLRFLIEDAGGSRSNLK